MVRHSAAGGLDDQRVFLALWPDGTVRRRIDAHVRRWSFDTRSQRYAPGDWHVTLHFLGHVPTDRLPDVADGVAVHVGPCDLILDQPQVWPQGLAVVGTSQVPAPLHELHTRLAGALHGLRLSVETRPYRPHLTLARHAGNAKPPTTPHRIVWPVRSYALVASTGRVGARYAVLRRYP